MSTLESMESHHFLRDAAVSDLSSALLLGCGQKSTSLFERLIGVLLLCYCFVTAFFMMYHAEASIRTYGAARGAVIIVAMLLPQLLSYFWLLPRAEEKFTLLKAILQVDLHVLHETLARMELDRRQRALLQQNCWHNVLRGSAIVEDLVAAFQALDGDHTNSLDHDEVTELLKKYFPDAGEDRLRYLAFKADPDGSGEVSLLEFQAFVLSEKGLRDQIVCRDRDARDALVRGLHREFERFDTDGNGKLDYAEFERFLMFYMKRELGGHPHRVRHLLRVVDPDRSGEISFEEFTANLLGLGE